MDSGFGNAIYWTLPVVTTIIHFTTLHHINLFSQSGITSDFLLNRSSSVLFCVRVCVCISLLSQSQSQSDVLDDWRFTADQFVLAPSRLRLTARFFSQLNSCGHCPYITSSLTRGWVCHLQLLLGLASAFILGS
jgi:hypothetical protein